MLKSKVAVFFAMLCTAFALYAQKPLMITVWAEPNADDKDNRVGSLIWEYYKSELATHSGLKVVAADTLQEAREKTIPLTTARPDAKQIKAYCAASETDIFCLVSLKSTPDHKFDIKADVYDNQGNLKKTVTRKFNAIKESDFVSVAFAHDTAVAIRGKSPVDEVNLEREKRLEQELADSDAKKKNTKDRPWLIKEQVKSKAGLE